MKKLIAAIILLAVAGVSAFYIKDYIDSRNPIYAIAQIEVTADTKPVGYTLAGYEWKFYNGKIAQMPTASWAELNMTSEPLLGGEQLTVTFTQPMQSSEIRRLDLERRQFGFTSITDNLIVPFESGGYLYEVRAQFRQGWVLYYFYITVA